MEFKKIFKAFFRLRKSLGCSNGHLKIECSIDCTPDALFISIPGICRIFYNSNGKFDLDIPNEPHPKELNISAQNERERKIFRIKENNDIRELYPEFKD